MATDSASRQSHAASETAQLVKEHSHAFQNRPNYTQTDSQPLLGPDTMDKPVAGSTEPPSAEAPTSAVAEPSEPTTETKPATEAPQETSPVGNVPEASESKISVGPKDEVVAGGKPGEKRNLDSTSTWPPAAEEPEKSEPEPSDERDAKKLKTDEPAADKSNGATSGADNGQKKASRPKKEKIKDAMHKIIPDGIGRRTRSQTKGT